MQESTPNTPEPPVDPDVVESNFDGSMEFFREVVETFIENVDELIPRIEDAIARGDAAQLHHIAHTIKGSVSHFGGRPARDVAFTLEKMGEKNKLAGAESHFRTLQHEIERVKEALLELVGAPEPEAG